MKSLDKCKQVAARVNLEVADWLKSYFKTKAAGAEMLIPWCVEILKNEMLHLKSVFTRDQLYLVLSAYDNVRDNNAYWSLDFLKGHISRYLQGRNLDFGIFQVLESLTQLQIVALIIWAEAFWVSKCNDGITFEQYIDALGQD